MYDDIEVSLFSSMTDKYEIYFSWDIFYGIVYAEAEESYELREQMKRELVDAYKVMGKPTGEFIKQFVRKYDVQMPSDIVFDEETFMNTFMNIDKL